MKRYDRGTIVCLGLSLAGALLCGALLGLHTRGAVAGGLLASVCGEEGSGCDRVLSSRWSVFPPARGPDPATVTSTGEAAPDGGTESPPAGGVPVSALGLFYFSALSVWFGVIGRPDPERAFLYRGVLGLCSLGALASVAFTVVMGALVKAWCPLCVATHVTNGLLLAAVFVSRPRTEGASPGTGRGGSAGPIVLVEPYPGLRLLSVAGVLLLAIGVAEWQAAQAATFRGMSERLGESLRRLREDAHHLEISYYQQEKIDFEKDIREDDPVIEAKPGVRNTVVLFSDIECPSCAKFDRFLFEEILPLYNGHLRVVFKHYPLTEVHPHAMKAAMALEAARIQGQFWGMHDLLLDRREELASVDYPELAAELGLDPLRLVKDMYSPEVRRRIAEDMSLGRRVGVSATPGVFLNGRLVDRLARDLLGFWKLRVESLKRLWGQKW